MFVDRGLFSEQNRKLDSGEKMGFLNISWDIGLGFDLTSLPFTDMIYKYLICNKLEHIIL